MHNYYSGAVMVMIVVVW